MRRAGLAAAGLRTALVRAIAEYATAEQQALARQHDLAAFLASHLGPVVRASILLGLASAPLLGLAALVAWGSIPDRGDGRLAEAGRWLMAHPELVTSPEFAAAVRLLATSLDEAALSALGLPPPLLVKLDGGRGVETNAAGMVAVGSLLGLFRETPVRVERVATASAADPPVGVSGRLDRVPEGDQVRIERYEAPGEPPRYVVYVGPTETFSPVAGDEPWDLTSNVAGVAGLSAGSFRATELAMHDAGIGPGDEVQLVGFSQGGLVASLVAASGDWNVRGLETHGAPVGNIELPSGLNGLAVRHTDDFIPALAGPQLDHSLVQIEREAFADGRPLPTTQAAPAHQRVAYAETAALVDAARSSVVRDQVAAMDDFTSDYAGREGAGITVFRYHAERGAPEATSSRG